MNVDTSVWIVLALLVGIFIGIIFARISLEGKVRKALKTKDLEEQLGQKEQELQQKAQEIGAFKSEVGDHFVETAALVNQMTQSYKAVYDHLEKGAYSLVGEEDLQKRLEDVQSEPVMLEYLGQKRRLTETADSAVDLRPEVAPEETEAQEDVIPEVQAIDDQFIVELNDSPTQSDELLDDVAEALNLSSDQVLKLFERAPGAITKPITEAKAKSVKAVFETHGLSSSIRQTN